MKNKILIIEDNENNMYLLTYLLEQNGYEVVQAMDGSQGIKMACSENPNLILLDIQLPVMSGYEVARRLRQNKAFEKLPIIAVTSYAMPGDKDKAMASGCSGYVEKPINPGTFIDDLQKFL